MLHVNNTIKWHWLSDAFCSALRREDKSPVDFRWIALIFTLISKIPQIVHFLYASNCLNRKPYMNFVIISSDFFRCLNYELMHLLYKICQFFSVEIKYKKNWIGNLKVVQEVGAVLAFKPFHRVVVVCLLAVTKTISFSTANEFP